MTMVTDKGYTATAAATVAAALILATVYVAQYGFDLWPCALCYVQRVPYLLILVMGGLSLMPAVDSRSRRIVLFHIVGLFLLTAAWGFYHAGVEVKWWPGPDSCTGNRGQVAIEDLSAALGKPGAPGCDEAAFVFMGLSMAAYNVIAALVLAGASLFAALRKDWWTAP